MATEIQLHHIGEVVLAGLLRRLSSRHNLDLPCKLHDGRGLAASIDRQQLAQPLSFEANVPLAPFEINGEAVRFDGAHGVDVLCRSQMSVGLAFEAKLGLNRLTHAEFTRRFLNLPSFTRHRPPRIKGSMIAILNYRALREDVELPLRTHGDSGVELAKDWFLVIRREVGNQWRQPPALGRNAHVLVFEEIVERFGDGRAFDSEVHRLVGNDFHRCWELGR